MSADEQTATPLPSYQPSKGDKRVVLTIILTLVFTLLLNGLYTTWAVARSQHTWCDTIRIIVSAPPPPGNPSQNPSRAFDQRLHADFVTLKNHLGC